jgi:hypothetical protein
MSCKIEIYIRKYVAMYDIPPAMTPRLSNPANAAIGGINCTMTAGFEVNLGTAEELPLLAIKLNIPEPINPEYTWLVL